MLNRLLCCTALLGLVACVDPSSASGATGDTTLYAYDNANKRVLFWGDVAAAYTAGSFTTPTATLTTSNFDKVTPLGWGGMAMDQTRNRMYLVGEGGDVVRLDSVRSLNGSVSSTNVVAFKLDSSERFTNSKFGQAALDPSNDTLYVTENGDNGTRIWVVSAASGRLNGVTVPLQKLSQANDTGGFGVAGYAGEVYASFANGDDVGNPVLTGYRLRKGNSSAFDPAKVILGDLTGLGSYATLALDQSNSILYTGVDAAAFSGATSPVLVFRTGQFGGSNNQAPDGTLGDKTVVSDLRVLAHSGNKDWLVGLSAAGSPTLWIWKNPSTPASATFKALLAPTGSQLRGAALDGTP
ncbi:MAG TPA: hypothetical protein VJ505_03430 [Holophagaceae bacterium]|nr:hypothetical protein [Holophagaceae bacterium]